MNEPEIRVGSFVAFHLSDAGGRENLLKEENALGFVTAVAGIDKNGFYIRAVYPEKKVSKSICLPAGELNWLGDSTLEGIMGALPNISLSLLKERNQLRRENHQLKQKIADLERDNSFLGRELIEAETLE